MKKIDLHIHTQSGVSETKYELSMDILRDYIINEELDAIAITNHNLFDLSEYNKISTELNIKVFPGVEVDLEKGHILIICDINNKEELSQYCSLLSEYITDQNSTLTINEFLKIFPNQFLSDSLLIPHYKKNPRIKDDIINQLNDISKINAGEVKNPKAFTSMKKDKSEKLTPLLFSDFRASASYNGNNNSFRVRQTYVNVDEININTLKMCFVDHNDSQVTLSKKDGINLFDLKNGLTVSTGLNVIIGKRSSGKSHFLNSIHESSDNDLIKYIKQFELIEKSAEKQEEVFNKSITQSNSMQRQDYLKEFSTIVATALEINDTKFPHEIDEYLNSLKNYAINNELEDVYSKTELFKETKFTTTTLTSLEKLINAVILIVEHKEYQEIIQNNIDYDDLKQLLIDLIDEYRKQNLDNIKKEHVNNIIDSIKSELHLETSAPIVKEIEFSPIAERNVFISKFNSLVSTLRKEKVIHSMEVGNFRNVATRKPFNNVTEIKREISGKYSLSEIFKKYYDSNPYKYLKEIYDSMDINDTEIYKAFVNIEISILNANGKRVSGGQMAEYNFLRKIEGALEHEVLLIDEPESSFDNVFLNQDINKKIKSISKHIPVFISTHNSTVGMSIQPDYLIYTQEKEIDGRPIFSIFTGLPTSEFLIDENNLKYKTLDALLTCLEAGTEPYEKRREVYELLKNFEQ